MAIIKNCCCCSLRTGTLIIGWLELIGGIFGILTVILMMAFMSTIKIKNYSEGDIIRSSENSTTTEEILTDDSDDAVGKAAFVFMFVILIAMLIYYICFTILAAFLILGVRKQNMRYVKLWVQIKTVLLIIAFIGIVLQLLLMLMDVDSNIRSQIIIAVIDALLICSVHSYYDQITETSVPTY